MKPAPRLIAITAAASAAGVVLFVVPALGPAWIALLAVVGAVAVLDLIALARSAGPRVARQAAHSMALGVERRIRLELGNDAAHPIVADVFDHAPDTFALRGQPARVRIEPGHFAFVDYRVTPQRRGRHRFGHVDVRQYSPLSFWTRRQLVGTPEPVNVFPNFAAVSKYTVLGVDSQAAAGGLHLRPRRGEGSEFHQLREYRVGDTFRQIDWKATARLGKLIAKEYQEERDQQIVFLVDTGRRMLAQEAGLSHFDHVLNAMLLLSYLALRQGDAVGFLTCGEPAQWMKPRKGLSTMSVLTNRLFELQPEPVAVDYQAAATALAQRQKRRALVVLLTNIRDEDSTDLKAAFGLLRRRHLLLVASLRETGIDALLQRPFQDFDGALNFASAHHYLDSRRATHDALGGKGVYIEDTSCDDLPQAIANRYLEIKRAGVL